MADRLARDRARLIGASIGSAIKYLNRSPVDVSTALFTVAAVLVLLGLSLVQHRNNI